YSIRPALVVTALVALCAAMLSSTLRAQSADSDVAVTRPVIAEDLIGVELINPVADDGFAGEAFLRKPPGNGPFPAVLLVHGGAPRWSTAALRDYSTHIHASRFLQAGYVVVAITRRDLD